MPGFGRGPAPNPKLSDLLLPGPPVAAECWPARPSVDERPANFKRMHDQALEG